MKVCGERGDYLEVVMFLFVALSVLFVVVLVLLILVLVWHIRTVGNSDSAFLSFILIVATIAVIIVWLISANQLDKAREKQSSSIRTHQPQRVTL